MAYSPLLETHRLKLITFSEAYLSHRYVGWLNDPLVVRYSEQRHRSHTLESCRQYLKSFVDTPHYFWAIDAIDPHIGHIGNMNAYIDKMNSVADVGILIGDRTAWRKGYGREAWMAVCNYLLHDIGIRKVTAGTLAVNKGMIRIMEQTGMIADGRRIRQCMVDGSEVDLIHTALFGNKI
ncbi:MAG: GNAT family N-acetyltransferase [Syntrophales bacterium]